SDCRRRFRTRGGSMAEGRPVRRRALHSSRSDRSFRPRSRNTAGIGRGRVPGRMGDRITVGPRPSLFTAEDFISPKAAAAYTRACTLAEHRGDVRQLFTAVFGLWTSNIGSGNSLVSRRLSARLLELTAGETEDELRLQAHHSAWATCFLAGEPAAAHEHCEAGRQLYDPERHRAHRLLYGGHDPGVCAGYIGALVHWLLGYPAKGLRIGSEALALGQRIAHPLSLEQALIFNAMFHLDRGEPELALQRLAAIEALVAEQRLGFMMEPRVLRAAALNLQGAFEEAAACLRDGLASPLGTMLRPYGLAGLAQALARLGEHGTALAVAREGLRTQEITGWRKWDAELHRIEGVALFGLNRL